MINKLKWQLTHAMVFNILIILNIAIKTLFLLKCIKFSYQGRIFIL